MWRFTRTASATAVGAAVEADLDHAERAGFGLAVIGRSVALAPIGLYYGYVLHWPSGLYALLAVSLLIAIGLVQLPLLGTRHERVWHRYALFAFDVTAFAAHLALVPLSTGGDVPQNLVFLRGITLVFIIIAASVLTLSPKLVLWTGICAVAALWAAIGWILAGMDRIITWSDLPAGPSREQYVAVVLDPDFIALQSRVMDSIIILLVTGIAALAVHRARAVVRARAAAEHQRNRVLRLFGQYVPEQVAAALMDTQTLAPQTRDASVLFADIKDFTRLSESLAPADVIGLLNRFFDEAATVIVMRGGVVVNFVGDAMVVAFNAPLPAADHAVRAVEASRALLDLAGSRDFAGHRLALRIGVASGAVAAGTVGGAGRQTYTIYGDTVNLAQRLQELTKELDTDCLISDATHAAAGAACDDAVANGTVTIRGREQPVGVFAIAHPKAPTMSVSPPMVSQPLPQPT
ncbi:adenylate/guanylate cyclase domain-containing protein [Reyranella sp. CPCC 100927]|uniref:adenylate/guanylate cyclase domain-containing protein n=1 Tax=Reyranella sp. CPCC 100927 TaxID=2599616 RepID=UPI0011B72D61|nr:adenylate/guanylate cyclase domain-containing protein [Reyranella sp. CPCC 100927]TWT15417.1 adenylate/guanylate cyclase domain-containing protein [Reyranella sp. CPCC 100927]